MLILDDSLYSRARSKAVELLANVHDHTTGKFVRGFRLLTLGWSDGNTFVPLYFVPLCFSLLSSHKQENRYVEMSTDIDKRTAGYKRRQESMMKSSMALLELLEQALAAGVQASYLLFDSWFSFPIHHHECFKAWHSRYLYA